MDKYINNTDYDVVGEKLFFPKKYANKNVTLEKGFAISNEHLTKTFLNFDLKGKRVLTVGSSGDQVINAILGGACDITLIDANIYTQFFVEYKLAFIKTFDYSVFNDLYIRPEFFSWKIYSKISHLISKDVRQVWDTIMLETDSVVRSFWNFSGKTILDTMLDVDHRTRFSAFYKEKNVYYKLKKLLKSENLKIDYKIADLEEFPSAINGKYDLIYLSNIYDYFVDNKKENFERTVRNLYYNHLNPKGKILVNYNFSKKREAPKTIGTRPVENLELAKTRRNDDDEIWLITKPENKQEKEITL